MHKILMRIMLPYFFLLLWCNIIFTMIYEKEKFENWRKRKNFVSIIITLGRYVFFLFPQTCVTMTWQFMFLVDVVYWMNVIFWRKNLNNLRKSKVRERKKKKLHKNAIQMSKNNNEIDFWLFLWEKIGEKLIFFSLKIIKEQ
jgi:hypothetical protein